MSPWRPFAPSPGPWRCALLAIALTSAATTVSSSAHADRLATARGGACASVRRISVAHQKFGCGNAIPQYPQRALPHWQHSECDHRMAQTANGTLRHATNAAGSSDDVDVGWDDLPTPVTEPPPGSVAPKVSEIRALSPSFPLVATAPHPSLGQAAPAGDTQVAAEVRDSELIVDAQHDTPLLQSELPKTSQVEVPDFRRHQLNPTVIVAAMGAAVALIVASAGTPQFPNVAAARDDVRIARIPEARLAEPPPEPPRAEPTQPPTVTATAALAAAAAPAVPAEQPPVATSRQNAVVVTVKVFPENSVIFRAGEKLGYGAVQVSVEHDAKQRLTALHDGYLPFNFTLDGSRDTVVVRLQHVPSPQPAAVSDSPF
jgi:hypothetical protein